MGLSRSQPEVDNDSANWNIPPFWHKLNSFFLFPFQRTPFMYAVVLSLCAYAMFMGLLIGIAVFVGLMLAVSRYAFKAAAYASRGVLDSSDYDHYPLDADLKVLPWKFFGVLLVHGFVIGMLAQASIKLGVLGNLGSSFLIPVTLMVLISTGSLSSAINPFILLGTIAGIGLPYFLLCLFLFLLMQGAPMAMGFLLALVPKAMLAPLMAFAIIYFLWVIAAMIGYVMYQNHAEFGIEPDKAPEAEDGSTVQIDPQAAEAKRRDAAVAQLVQSGDMQAAQDEAREWQRLNYDNVADQRRYHRVLKLTDKTAELARHGQQFIDLLLRKHQASEALEVWGSCYKRMPGFKLESAEASLALAHTAWKRQQGSHALAVLQNFEKNYPGSPVIPQAQELIVRVLKQGLGKPDQAVRVFMRMKMRYPEHPSTQEAAWILRDELPQDPAKSAAPVAPV
ncbi:hypothetical protein ABE501_02395 [Comamonas testosteroni]